MKILMIANYVSFPWETGNCRFMYILKKLNNKKNSIELITTNFYHNKKDKRKIKVHDLKKMPYKITLIDEPGYKKNVSFRRFYSHYVLSQNLNKYLNNIDYVPDVIYCSVPSLDVAYVAAKFSKKHKIKFIIDVQDLWPEAFKMVFNVPILSTLIFTPFNKKANYIYSCADEIIAVSETYVNRAISANNKVKIGYSVFLGTDLKYFDECKNKFSVENNKQNIRIAYVGTLGHSYDIRCIIDSIKLLNDKGFNNIEFIVMGDGPLKDVFEKYAKKKCVNCSFTGRLEYSKMVGMLCSCDIAVNPIVHGAAQSIINKVGDYAAAGIPVINTQECMEYRNLIDEYQAGINCINDDINDISSNIEKLIKNKKLRITYGAGNRKLAENLFDREKTYNKIIKMIENR